MVFPKRLGEEILAFSPVLCPEIKSASSGKEVRTRREEKTNVGTTLFCYNFSDNS